MSDEDLNTTIKVSVDPTGVESGTTRVKRSLADMGKAASDVGRQTSDAMGSGGDAAAKKVEIAARRISNEFKRLQVDAESMGKSLSEKIVIKADAYGVPRAVIEEQRAALKRFEDAQRMANPQMVQFQKLADASGQSVKGFSAALRQVPAQMTDIIVSLQGGQAPLTVLLQQGGQLKDVFGGIGPAAKALGGYIMSLVNPYTVAAAAVAGLGVAMASINGKDKALLALSTQLTGTGRASAAATGDIKGLIKELNNVPGISKSAATAILGEFAKVQGLGGNMFRGLGASVADFAAATGTDLPNAARKLASAFADPAKGARELDESLGTLTASQIIAIEKMADMGDKAGAQAALLDALKEATQGLADQAMTPLGKATEDLSNAWDEMLTNVGNADALRSANSSLAEMIGMVARLTTGLANMKLPAWMGTGFDFTRASFNAFFDYSKPKVAPEGSWGDGGAAGSWAPTKTETDRQVKAALDATKGYISQSESVAKLKAVASQAKAALGELEVQSKGNSAEAELLRERISGVNEKLADMAKKAKGPKEPISEAAKGLALYNNLMDRAAGFEKEWEEDVNKLRAALDGKTISQKQFNESIDVLYKKQPLMVEAAKAEAEALQDRNKAFEDAVKAQDKQAKSVEDALKKQQEHNAGIGLSKEALAELEAATMLANAAELERQANLSDGVMRSPEIIDGLKREAQAMRDLATAKITGAQRQAGVDAANDMAKEQKKAAEASEKYWEDALMRAFESGKGFFESLWDTIKNTLKTQVLKVMVQGVTGGIGMGAASAAGASTLGGSVGSSLIGNGLSTIGTKALDYLGLGSVSGAISGFGTAASAATQSLLGITGTTAQMVTSLVKAGYASAPGMATGVGLGTSLTSALGAIPGWGWAAMASVAVAGILKGHGETRSGATYDTGADGLARYQQGPSGGEIAGDTARAMFNATKTSIQDTLKLVGSSATVTGYTAGLESSGKGKGFAFAGGYVDGKSFGDSDGREGHVSGQWKYQTLSAEQAMAAYANELKKSTLEALQAATDIPAIISNQLAGVDINALNQEGLDNLMTAIGGTINLVNGFVQQGNISAMKELQNLSFDVAAGLIAAAGGMETLSTNLGTYYTNFYSAEEQRAQTIKTINAATAGSGLDAATVTRDQFRQIVEAQDLTTESGRATYAALLGVSGAMATLITASETAAAAANKAAVEANKAAAKSAIEATITATQNAADDLITLYGDLTAAMSEIQPPVKSLVDQWYDSTEALTTLTQGLAEALGELPEATVIDKLKATLATLASATDGIANISDQIFGLQTGKGNQAAVNLLQGRETALFAELATSNDPGAVAAKLASTMLTRIKLQGELADKVTNDALKSQFDASTTLAQLEKTNRDKQIDAIRKQISAAETLLDVVGSMKGYLAELRFGDLSALNPGDQLSAAQGNYNTLLSGAQGGDTKAMQDLQGGASNYLKEAQGYYGGATSQYASIFQAVTSGLEQFGATPVTDITLLQNQLGYLEKIEAASIDLQTVVTDTTDLQIEGLNSINTVLTTRQDEARQEAADNKKAVQEQIAELKAIVAGQEAQIKQQAAIYEGLMERLTTATKALESLDNTSKQTAAAPV